VGHRRHRLSGIEIPERISKRSEQHWRRFSERSGYGEENTSQESPGRDW
jgi:hypothetical protein